VVFFGELYTFYFSTFSGSEGYLFGSVDELTHTGRLHLAFVLFGKCFPFSLRSTCTYFHARRSLGAAPILLWGQGKVFSWSNEFLCPSGKDFSHSVRLLFQMKTLVLGTHFFTFYFDTNVIIICFRE